MKNFLVTLGEVVIGVLILVVVVFGIYKSFADDSTEAASTKMTESVNKIEGASLINTYTK